VARDLHSIVEDIHRTLEIPIQEADSYVKALIGGGWAPADGREEEVARSLCARGMLIRDPRGRSFLAVHPRLAVSNLFRAYEERLMRQRKEKRLLVDKLTLDLVPLIPGESKRTNPSAPRGGSTASR